MNLQDQRLTALGGVIAAPNDILGLIIAILPDVVHAILGIFQKHKPEFDALVAQIIATNFDDAIKLQMITALLPAK